MGFEIVVLNRAYGEIDEALEFYSNVSDQISKKFMFDLQRCWKSLEKNPFFEMRHKDFRVVHLKKFPFIVVFTIDEKRKLVRIYSVFHTSQDPEKLP
jgi:hypothetical protein